MDTFEFPKTSSIIVRSVMKFSPLRKVNVKCLTVPNVVTHLLSAVYVLMLLHPLLMASAFVQKANTLIMRSSVFSVKWKHVRLAPSIPILNARFVCPIEALF